MTIRYDKTDPILNREYARTTADLSGQWSGQRILSKINHLRNWRYANPIFMSSGCKQHTGGVSNHADLWPIIRNITKRDTTTPDRYFAIVADPMTYINSSDVYQALGWRGTHASDIWYTNYRQFSGITSGTFDATEFPRKDMSIVAVTGDKNNTDVWGPLTVTPSAEFEKVGIRYHGMAFRGLGLFEIPSPELTAKQMGCSPEEVSKDTIVRGDVTPRTETYGNLFDLIGNSTDVEDTVERATRRHWQWCHPFGVWIGNGSGFAVNTFHNVFGNSTSTIKFEPRRLFDDRKKVRITIAMVITADADCQIRISNTTDAPYLYTYTVPATYSTPTLVTLSAATTDLRVTRSIKNLMKFEFKYPTTAEGIIIHSLAIFEEDPFDATVL